MTNRPGRWTRRQFSQALAATAASTLLVRTASALPFAERDGFAFAGSSTDDPLEGTVRVYRVSADTWRQVHAVDAASPAHLVMHPAMPVLYVVHDVSAWDHRPRGAVSAYRFNAATGHLAPIGTQPLSLSATHPKHAVITDGAQALFVSAEAGGIYNLLPIAADGSLQPVSAIRKELGLGDDLYAKPAAPHHAVLHADGSLYTADPGQETISRFAVSRNDITLQQRSRIHPGAGASQIAFSASGHAYAMHAGDGLISMHSVSAEGLSPAMQTCPGASGQASMHMHPDGRFLVTSDDDGLHVLRVHPRDGLVVQKHVPQPRLQQMQFAREGTELIGLTASGSITAQTFDPHTGALGSRHVLAQADGAGSLLLHLV